MPLFVCVRMCVSVLIVVVQRPSVFPSPLPDRLCPFFRSAVRALLCRWNPTVAYELRNKHACQMHRLASLTIGTLLSTCINVKRFFFFSLSGSLQIVSVGKHVKGYHYIMANLVRGTLVCLIVPGLYVQCFNSATISAMVQIDLTKQKSIVSLKQFALSHSLKYLNKLRLQMWTCIPAWKKQVCLEGAGLKSWFSSKIHHQNPKRLIYSPRRPESCQIPGDRCVQLASTAEAQRSKWSKLHFEAASLDCCGETGNSDLPLCLFAPPTPQGFQGYQPGALHAWRCKCHGIPAGWLQQPNGHQANAALEQAGPAGVPRLGRTAKGLPISISANILWINSKWMLLFQLSQRHLCPVK